LWGANSASFWRHWCFQIKWLHLIGDIGSFALGDALAPKQRVLVQDMFRAINALRRYKQTLIELRQLQIQMPELLTRHELHFPLLGIFSSIFLAGPRRDRSPTLLGA
jgi:hypothetical protein